MILNLNQRDELESRARSFQLDLEDYVVGDEDILLVDEFMKKHIPELSKNMKRDEFDHVSYQRHAISEIKTRMCQCILECPPYLQSYYTYMSPYDIIWQYIYEMRNYIKQSRTTTQHEMFKAQKDAAEELLNYFIDYGGSVEAYPYTKIYDHGSENHSEV